MTMTVKIWSCCKYIIIITIATWQREDQWKLQIWLCRWCLRFQSLRSGRLLSCPSLLEIIIKWEEAVLGWKRNTLIHFHPYLNFAAHLCWWQARRGRHRECRGPSRKSWHRDSRDFREVLKVSKVAKVEYLPKPGLRKGCRGRARGRGRWSATWEISLVASYIKKTLGDINRWWLFGRRHQEISTEI